MPIVETEVTNYWDFQAGKTGEPLIITDIDNFIAIKLISLQKQHKII